MLVFDYFFISFDATTTCLRRKVRCEEKRKKRGGEGRRGEKWSVSVGEKMHSNLSNALKYGR